jgi:hypothetical protein
MLKIPYFLGLSNHVLVSLSVLHSCGL